MDHPRILAVNADSGTDQGGREGTAESRGTGTKTCPDAGKQGQAGCCDQIAERSYGAHLADR